MNLFALKIRFSNISTPNLRTVFTKKNRISCYKYANIVVAVVDD